jgi:hypothetical protein
MLRIVKRLIALSLGVHLEQLEQRMGLTWPRPFLLRPLEARFLTILGCFLVELEYGGCCELWRELPGGVKESRTCSDVLYVVWKWQRVTNWRVGFSTWNLASVPWFSRRVCSWRRAERITCELSGRWCSAGNPPVRGINLAFQ